MRTCYAIAILKMRSIPGLDPPASECLLQQVVFYSSSAGNGRFPRSLIPTDLLRVHASDFEEALRLARKAVADWRPELVPYFEPVT